ncbi:hypothetical protein EZV73_01215 [Acidaminobacter sp. JC074]|uniref:hypothetical protein n=1 Tax=Acidaminobacter sp. JC074 TaxID=2530199 RepID=UPI001F107A07|nr:hypothetical protein [Acidaminobacter sp. JC074]MCH4886162.1 hypothetical protein [Acidaminobacter sp. JC074]
MKKIIKANELHQTMKLRQMGADVEVVNSKLCYVKFNINGIDLSYVYNINKKNEYFLERIKPYPLPLKAYKCEEDVVDIIAIDIEQFKNVCSSKNVDDFIDFLKQMKLAVNKFEDLILYYNVSREDISEFQDILSNLNKKIDQSKEESERLYFKKNPDFL